MSATIIRTVTDKKQALLLQAIGEGDSSGIEAALEMGANINSKNEQGESPLHSAVFVGNPHILALLIERGADVNAKDGKGYTPLDSAIKQDRIEVIKKLLDSKIHFNTTDKAPSRDETLPLHLAAFYGNAEIIELLLQRGAQIRATNHIEKTILHFADPAVIELLISKGADIDAADIDKQTPLHTAVVTEKKEVINLLLKHGANINAKDRDGITPLYAAVSQKNIEIVKSLLSHEKINIELPDKKGVTPLYLAVELKVLNIIELLIKKGANCNATSRVRQGASALQSAAYAGDIKIVSALLEGGADINQARMKGESALFFAALAKHTEIIKLLLAKKPRLKIVQEDLEVLEDNGTIDKNILNLFKTYIEDNSPRNAIPKKGSKQISAPLVESYNNREVQQIRKCIEQCKNLENYDFNILRMPQGYRLTISEKEHSENSPSKLISACILLFRQNGPGIRVEYEEKTLSLLIATGDAKAIESLSGVLLLDSDEHISLHERMALCFNEISETLQMNQNNAVKYIQWSLSQSESSLEIKVYYHLDHRKSSIPSLIEKLKITGIDCAIMRNGYGVILNHPLEILTDTQECREYCANLNKKIHPEKNEAVTAVTQAEEKIEIIPEVKTPSKPDLFLIALEPQQDLSAEVKFQADYQDTPILIKKEGQFRIYGYKKGLWEEMPLNLEPLTETEKQSLNALAFGTELIAHNLLENARLPSELVGKLRTDITRSHYIALIRGLNEPPELPRNTRKREKMSEVKKPKETPQKTTKRIGVKGGFFQPPAAALHPVVKAKKGNPITPTIKSDVTPLQSPTDVSSGSLPPVDLPLSGFRKKERVAAPAQSAQLPIKPSNFALKPVENSDNLPLLPLSKIHNARCGLDGQALPQKTKKVTTTSSQLAPQKSTPAASSSYTPQQKDIAELGALLKEYHSLDNSAEKSYLIRAIYYKVIQTILPKVETDQNTHSKKRETHEQYGHVRHILVHKFLEPSGEAIRPKEDFLLGPKTNFLLRVANLLTKTKPIGEEIKFLQPMLDDFLKRNKTEACTEQQLIELMNAELTCLQSALKILDSRDKFECYNNFNVTSYRNHVFSCMASMVLIVECYNQLSNKGIQFPRNEDQLLNDCRLKLRNILMHTNQNSHEPKRMVCAQNSHQFRIFEPKIQDRDLYSLCGKFESIKGGFSPELPGASSQSSSSSSLSYS